ncbi:acetyltransferase, GNAT family [Seminavis robusta]|uniref:Acetyltransferase, GNAT family n=1 Tax=Seminavis robusta TaxID=568900 RepID=A0A9N8E1D7_9STRA|nr:acetyltransferase, GNAT family [Seminavis robusta]|eukprot:Sro550_g164680.1 acetyltransferase, GNAT family (194) ;mRNA; r:27833-28414
MGWSAAALSNIPSLRRQVINIRRWEPSDAPKIARLFHETVRTVNLQDYSWAQVQAWAPDDYLDCRDWAQVQADRFTVVAETKKNNDGCVLVGFAELETHNGHIDCFYCHKDYQRMGVGRKLYSALEEEARLHNHKQLLVEASITAKPFFEQMGFSVTTPQTVTCRGQSFLNYQMIKSLNNSNQHNNTRTEDNG